MAYGLRTSVVLVVTLGILGWALPRRVVTNLLERIRRTARWLVATTNERPKVALLFVWIIALIPMIYLSAAVRHYGVNVPTLDDWWVAALLEKAHTSGLRLSDIFQQQEEARTAVPNVIFLLSAQHEWNVRDQMIVSLIASWLTAAGLWVLLRRTIPNLAAIAVCFWLMVLTVFSPASFELWIFASGFPSFLPLLFLVGALTLIGTRLSIPWKFALCVAFSVASTFTLPHGLLAWGLTFPALLVAERHPRWRAWLGAWITVTAICAAIYFWDYAKPEGHPQFGPPVSLVQYAGFILQFLGGGLAYSLKHQPSTAATIFGAVQLVLLLITAIYISGRIRDREFFAKAIPWLAIAFCSIGAAFLAALGRVSFGASYALASRYVPFSLGLTLAVIALVAFVLSELFRPFRVRSRVIVTAIFLLAYLVPYRFAAANTFFFLRAYSAADHLAKAAVVFSQVIDTSAVIKKHVYPPGAKYVVEKAAALDRLNLLRPPLVRLNLVAALPHEVADGNRVAGRCETIVTTDDSYRATGWALLKTKSRPADCVLAAYQAAGGEPTLVAISGSPELRWEVARTSWPNDYLWSGWTVTVPRAAIPPDAELSFWAVDADEPRLYRLDRKTP